METLMTEWMTMMAMASPGGRETLVRLAERLAAIEAKAARKLEQAAGTIR